MPSKNTVKEYDVDSYYHVYNRGVNKRLVFKDDQDYSVFLSILKRHLAKGVVDKRGRKYEHLGNDLELVAFCLMPNHYHMFLYQKDDWRAMERLMRRVGTAYVAYFNNKYRRLGPLFQARYKASRIDNEAYLQHISRYIHLNPKDYKHYEWSSYQYYIGKKSADWVKPAKILSIFKDNHEYIRFVDDFDDYEQTKELVDLYKAG